mgnify:CR=1 FL=1
MKMSVFNQSPLLITLQFANSGVMLLRLSRLDRTDSSSLMVFINPGFELNVRRPCGMSFLKLVKLIGSSLLL